jgi:hypothetical protein
MAAIAGHQSPGRHRKPILPEQAERLHNLSKAGFDATLLVSPAAAAVPLADHHPAAALWWRILDQLPRTNLEPGPSDNQHRPSDQAHAREVTGAAATRAALGAASRRRPAPLNRAKRADIEADVRSSSTTSLRPGTVHPIPHHHRWCQDSARALYGAKYHHSTCYEPRAAHGLPRLARAKSPSPLKRI